MNKWYLLKDIVHSGRKDIRGKPVEAQKYKGLIGSLVKFDLDSVEQFKPLMFDIYQHRDYDYWTTTAVISLVIAENDDVFLETVNTIYIFESFSDRGFWDEKSSDTKRILQSAL